MSKIDELREPTRAELQAIQVALVGYHELSQQPNVDWRDRAVCLLRLVDALLGPHLLAGFLQGLDDAIAEARS